MELFILICKYKKLKRWSSDGKVLWSWCICGGLLSGLDQDFGLCSDSLLRWHSLLSWSYGPWWFKEVRNGVRGFVCDLNERALLFRCMVAGSIGIFSTSHGFAKCFWKPLFILQVIFIAWRSFYSLEIILQPGGKKEKPFLQAMEKIETF